MFSVFDLFKRSSPFRSLLDVFLILPFQRVFDPRGGAFAFQRRLDHIQ